MIEPGSVQWDSEDEYRLRLNNGLSEDFPGVSFVDGVSVAPVKARIVLRLYQAFGSSLTVELWTLPTADPPPAKKRAVASRGDTKLKSRDTAVLDMEDEPDLPVKAEFAADDDDELGEMSRAELRELCERTGIKYHWNAGETKLRRLIRDSRDQA